MLGVMNREPKTVLNELRSLAISRLNIDVAHIDDLVNQRTQARADRDWEIADQLRDQLAQEGIELMDGPEGSQWRPALGSL